MTTDQTPPAEHDTAFRKTGERRAPRCTAQDHERREARCYDLLHKGLRDSEIVRLCSEEWSLASGTVKKYIARARAKLRELIAGGKTELQSDAYAFYKGIVEDEKARASDRLRAQENIDRLLGLSAPQKVAMTDPTGEKEATLPLDQIRQLSDDAVDKLAAAFDVLTEKRNASSGQAH
jgi:hypothetical protein